MEIGTKIQLNETHGFQEGVYEILEIETGKDGFRCARVKRAGLPSGVRNPRYWLNLDTRTHQDRFRSDLIEPREFVAVP